ncbi:MAG: DUF1957 domain-containing protein [Actinobacteria bacterium]|nr:DUF1957 domain-containing protein [Actinomycetota bacterium]
MSRPRGQLAIVLHTHMPYVESFGTWPFGEEWLWLSVAESYLRLAPVLSRAPVTVGVTPVLADQFERMRHAAGDRMLAFFADSREYVFGEDIAAFKAVGKPDQAAALEPQLADYRSAAERFLHADRDFNALFSSFSRDGRAELLGGPATHPVMPLLATDFGANLQLSVGLESHATRFGGGSGIWLPECAWSPVVTRHLRRSGVTHFCVDQSAVNDAGSLDNLEPVALDGGLVAAPVDWRTVDLVWHERGYPSAAAYRSSFDRTIHSLMPRANHGAAWDPEAARSQAREHAREFLVRVRERLDAYADQRNGDGLCVFAIDTELLGHWWYEGPWWLEAVCEGAAGAGVELATLGEAVARIPAVDRELRTSSWGEHKDLSTWDCPEVADIAWQTRAAELELFDALGHVPEVAESASAARAARELMALQSSDWAFMAKRETAGEYPRNRYAGHLAAFERAITAVSQSPDSDATAARGRPAGEGTTADEAGPAPGLTPQKLAKIRCAY